MLVACKRFAGGTSGRRDAVTGTIKDGGAPVFFSEVGKQKSGICISSMVLSMYLSYMNVSICIP